MAVAVPITPGIFSRSPVHLSCVLTVFSTALPHRAGFSALLALLLAGVEEPLAGHQPVHLELAPRSEREPVGGLELEGEDAGRLAGEELLALRDELEERAAVGDRAVRPEDLQVLDAHAADGDADRSLQVDARDVLHADGQRVLVLPVVPEHGRDVDLDLGGQPLVAGGVEDLGGLFAPGEEGLRDGQRLGGVGGLRKTRIDRFLPGDQPLPSEGQQAGQCQESPAEQTGPPPRRGMEGHAQPSVVVRCPSVRREASDDRTRNCR
jgi:hypothetical protein